MTDLLSSDRFHERDRQPDQRSAFERDRDRVLYSTHLRRLSGVTQVVDSGQGRSFHNRLVHTHKVEQVARRLAEYLSRETPEEDLSAIGGLDVSSCEAAALAHDLGHPPFGHAAEVVLDTLARDAGVSDGFEGNAQSFRVVTRLAKANLGFGGLNLTARTLNGILKYPWERSAAGQRGRKFGAYAEDLEVFHWALEAKHGFFSRDDRSVEAQVMDLADDITYAVHDLEDFYRVGLIPLHRLLAAAPDGERDLASDEDERSAFLRGVRARWRREEEHAKLARISEYGKALDRVLSDSNAIEKPVLRTPFDGTATQRAALRSFTSRLISRYVQATMIKPDNEPNEVVALGDDAQDLLDELMILKQLVWHYVITAPALAHQQAGQESVITSLWEAWSRDAQSCYPRLLPPGPKEALEELRDASISKDERETGMGRVVLDAICSLTEGQVLALHGRLTGRDAGSVIDAIVTR